MRVRSIREFPRTPFGRRETTSRSSGWMAWIICQPIINSSNVRLLRSILMGCFVIAVGGNAACAAPSGEDRLWSAVLIASNSSSETAAAAKALPPELQPVLARLKRVFGYKQFEVLGTDVKPVKDGAEFSLVPTKNFWM